MTAGCFIELSCNVNSIKQSTTRLSNVARSRRLHSRCSALRSLNTIQIMTRYIIPFLLLLLLLLFAFDTRADTYQYQGTLAPYDLDCSTVPNAGPLSSAFTSPHTAACPSVNLPNSCYYVPVGPVFCNQRGTKSRARDYYIFIVSAENSCPPGTRGTYPACGEDIDTCADIDLADVPDFVDQDIVRSGRGPRLTLVPVGNDVSSQACSVGCFFNTVRTSSVVRTILGVDYSYVSYKPTSIASPGSQVQDPGGCSGFTSDPPPASDEQSCGTSGAGYAQFGDKVLCFNPDGSQKPTVQPYVEPEPEPDPPGDGDGDGDGAQDGQDGQDGRNGGGSGGGGSGGGGSDGGGGGGGDSSALTNPDGSEILNPDGTPARPGDPAYPNSTCIGKAISDQCPFGGNPEVYAQCDQAWVCGGNAIECEKLRQIKKQRCDYENQIKESEFEKVFQKSEFFGYEAGEGVIPTSEIDLTDIFDTTGFLQSEACPMPIDMTIGLGGMSNTISINYEPFCSLARVAGVLVLISAGIFVIRVFAT